jgi:cyclopropane fatty-acyl-phospholipid synthase-like methyltransferase/8-oxo-dGTP pyrophosphatase MutT (NUDIX family)
MNWDNYWKNVYDSWTMPLQLGILDDWCKNTESDIDFLESVFEGDTGLRILDVSCGWGRHVNELTRRGYRTVGLDYSHSLLKLARSTLIKTGLPVRLILADRRKIWWEEKFDAVIQIYDAPWSEFWESYENHLKYMFRVYRVLKPGGYFITGTTDYQSSFEQAVLKEKTHIGSEYQKYLDELVTQGKFNHYERGKILDLMETALFSIQSESNSYNIGDGYNPDGDGYVLVCRAPKTTVELWVYTRNPEIQVLLLRRTQTAGWGRVFWQPVTGTIDWNENTGHAAVRELKEETGITAWQNWSELKKSFHFPTKGLGTLHKTLYAVEVEKQSIVMDPKEHDDYQWVSLENVPEMLYWDSNFKGYEIFRNFLGEL